MSGGKEEKGKKLVERYGQIYSQGCSGCPLETGCGPNFEVVLNIKKKESTKKD
ncbi:MAG: hypothetical protein QXR19_10775 [Candidatus Jordarchaeaceae archaeon]